MKYLYTTMLGILLLADAAPALALETEPAEDTQAQYQAVYGESAMMAEDEMNASRGAGFDPVSIAQLEAVNSGNTIVGGTTGFNMISGDAFDNASGMINIIQNSGNGVVIQNSMIVNVNMQ